MKTIAAALAKFHGIPPHRQLDLPDQPDRDETIEAFYQTHPDCKRPSDTILRCIINDALTGSL